MERREARMLGHSTYETGRPCRHGHMAYRHVSNGRCSECDKEYHAQPKRKITDRIAKKSYRSNAREDHLEYMKEYNARPEVKESKRLWKRERDERLQTNKRKNGLS